MPIVLNIRNMNSKFECSATTTIAAATVYQVATRGEKMKDEQQQKKTTTAKWMLIAFIKCWCWTASRRNQSWIPAALQCYDASQRAGYFLTVCCHSAYFRFSLFFAATAAAAFVFILSLLINLSYFSHISSFFVSPPSLCHMHMQSST